MKFIVTGTSGFLGLHVSMYQLDAGRQVVGIDYLNDFLRHQPEAGAPRSQCRLALCLHGQPDLADREGKALLSEES